MSATHFFKAMKCRWPQTALLLFLFPLALYAQRDLPELWGHRVHDDASVLTSEGIEKLERQLEEHEKATSNQVAVLIINTLGNDVLEDFSIRVAERWKLGTEKNDNGVLLLVVIDDRKIRIEVGQGLQGVLTDAVCGRIIRDEIAPAFRREDYGAGVDAGVQAILSAIAGEYSSDGSDAMSSTDWLLLWGAVAFFLSILIYSFYQEFKQPAAGGGSSGSYSSSGSSNWSSSSKSSFSGGGGRFDGGGSSGSW